MKTTTLTIGLLAALLLSACTTQGGDPFDQPPQVPPPDVATCGSEELVHGEGKNQAMRDCFKRNFEACTPATMSQVQYTIEGDPIRMSAKILGESNGKCSYELMVDNEDSFGTMERYTTTCSVFQEDSAEGETYLKFSGCENGKEIMI